MLLSLPPQHWSPWHSAFQLLIAGYVGDDHMMVRGVFHFSCSLSDLLRCGGPRHAVGALLHSEFFS
jgi:hypothetical protein